MLNALSFVATSIVNINAESSVYPIEYILDPLEIQLQSSIDCGRCAERIRVILFIF